MFTCTTEHISRIVQEKLNIIEVNAVFLFLDEVNVVFFFNFFFLESIIVNIFMLIYIHTRINIQLTHNYTILLSSKWKKMDGKSKNKSKKFQMIIARAK